MQDEREALQASKKAKAAAAKAAAKEGNQAAPADGQAAAEEVDPVKKAKKVSQAVSAPSRHVPFANRASFS